MDIAARNSLPPLGYSLSDLISGRSKTICMALAYSVLLAVLYRYELVVHWGYMGFEWNPSFFMGFLCVFLISGMAALLPTAANTRSVFLMISCYLHFFPALVLSAAGGVGVGYFAAIILGGLVFFIFSFLPLKRITSASASWSLILFVSCVMCVVILSLIVFHIGVGNFNFDYSEIYQYRADFKDNVPGYIGYLRPMATKVFLPLLVIIAFARGNIVAQVLSVVLLVFYFGYTNHKSVIAATVVSLALFYMFRNQVNVSIISKVFLGILIVCMIQVFIVPLVADLREASYLTSMVVRRTLFVPSLLDYYHVDYFSEHDFTYWSQSKVSLGFVSRVYDLNTPFLIGNEYFGRQTMAANTGFIGSGFSNAGYAGIFIYAAIMGITVSYLNEYGKQFGHAMVIGVAFTQIIGAITSSDLPSVFLTNGLILILITFMFFPRQQVYETVGQQR